MAEENNQDQVNTGAPAEESNSLEYTEGEKAEAEKPVEVKPKKSRPGVQQLITHINIYLLLFILVVVLAIGIVFIGIQKNKKITVDPTIATQQLSADAVKQVNGTESKVGDPKQILTIESNAIFTGKVLIRDSLDVAGSIKVGGPLTLPGLTVAGTTTLDQLQANTASIAGNASIQGQLSVQKTLNVTGGASFGGPISAPQLSIQSLQLNNDLQLNRHIDAGGGTPGRTDGGAAGSGGTTSVSGTDTAGTVTINTGSNPPVGCFLTVNFTQKFNATPHVVITPIGADAAAISYYVTRTTSGFSVCTASAAPAGRSFSFDYIAID